ncbi:MAG: thiamine pyrophosphate-dependent enzyme [Caldilineaceae bacterium]
MQQQDAGLFPGPQPRLQQPPRPHAVAGHRRPRRQPHRSGAAAVSGDGDTASIGIGQFKHAMRRNLPLVYIVENNGVYGLTKGQFSATADMGQQLKYQGVNEIPPLDICLEALAANATFVARSFAGHAQQVEALLKAALNHRGIAVIDIISPCVTFNNHDSSTKSYSYGKEHEIPLHELNFVPSYEQIEIDDYDDEVEVQMHDGSWIVLKQLGDDYDPTNKMMAYETLVKRPQRRQAAHRPLLRGRASPGHQRNAAHGR